MAPVRTGKTVVGGGASSALASFSNGASRSSVAFFLVARSNGVGGARLVVGTRCRRGRAGDGPRGGRPAGAAVRTVPFNGVDTRGDKEVAKMSLLQELLPQSFVESPPKEPS